MPYCHLITVGTSLEFTGDTTLAALMVTALQRVGTAAAEVKNPTTEWGQVVQHLLKLEGDRRIKSRQKENDPFPQELSYLHLTYHELGRAPGPEDRAYLLISDTDKGHACAVVIQEYLLRVALQGSPLPHIEIVRLKGLDPNRDSLGEEALDCLAQCVDDVVARFGESHDILLNISGGFKGLIPYATFLAAIYPCLRLLYLYKTSSTIKPIATLPVSFDAAAWRDWRALIKSVDGMPEGLARRSLVAALPPSLRPLFKDDGGLNFLGRTLSHRFQDQRLAQLNLHGHGDQLVALLKGQHRREVEKQLPIWRHSTVGDKVPEMVDHGRGHLQRVQELLAQILIPLQHAQPDFFNQEEYLALISALWLHDSGHAAEYLTLPLPVPFDKLCQGFETQGLHLPTAGFPSLSRDLHQLLIAGLLLNQETRAAYIPAGDFWSAERVQAMLWVCLYHRRSMPLAEGAEPFGFGPKEQPLLQVDTPCPDVLMVNGLPVRTRLLAALYSLCDGCDTQAERAASDEELYARRYSLQRGVGALLDQAGSILESAAGNQGERDTLRQFVNQRDEILAFCLSGSGAIEESLKALDAQVAECLYAFIKRSYFSGARPPLEEIGVVSILDRLQFLSRQSAFYTHHRGVQAVYILYHGEQSERHRFRVYAAGQREVVRPIVLGKSQGKKGGLAGELERSGPVLLAHGLEILVDEESLVEG